MGETKKWDIPNLVSGKALSCEVVNTLKITQQILIILVA